VIPGVVYRPEREVVVRGLKLLEADDVRLGRREPTEKIG
jgi:hypothetical protein